jgi:hypothetical protein
MKTKILTTFLFALTICIQAQKEQETINKLLNDWHQSAAVVDQQTYFDFIADDGIYIGTDSTEIWTKQAFFDWSTPHFNAGKTWDFKTNSRNIYLSEDEKIAWFDELVTNGKITLRGSGVLEMNENTWKIKHYVLSVPVPNEKFNAVRDVLIAPQEKLEKEE